MPSPEPSTYRYLLAGAERPAGDVLESAYAREDLKERAVVRDTHSKTYKVFLDWGGFWAWRRALPPSAPRCFDEVVFGHFPQRLKFDLDIPEARLPAPAPSEHAPEACTGEIDRYLGELFDLPGGVLSGIEPFVPAEDPRGPRGRAADEVLEVLIEAVLGELEATYGLSDGVAPTREDLIVTESSGPVGGPPGGGEARPAWKYSFHLLVASYAVANNEEAKEFSARVREALPGWVAEFVDPQVNKSLQNFRLAGSTKPGSSRVKTVTTRFGTKESAPEATTVAPPPEVRLLTRRCASVGERGGKLGDVSAEVESLGEADLRRVEEALAAAGVTEGHVLRQSRGRRLEFRRQRPSYCRLCEEVHHRDNTLVVRLEPADGDATVGTSRLVEYCRHAPGRARTVATVDVAPLDLAGFARPRAPKAALPPDSADAGPRVEEVVQQCLGPPPGGAGDPGGAAVRGGGALSTRFEELPSRHVYSEPRMRPYELVPTLAVKAQMKLGKTRELKAYLTRNFPAGGLRERVVRFVTFRKTFSRSIQREHFGDFELYSDHSGDLDHVRFPRLIVQVESLHRLPMAAVPEPVDLLVLDEVESILGQFDSGLHRNFTAAFAMFEWMLRTAAHVVCMDANLSDRTLRILELFRGDRPPLFHWNQYQVAAGDTYRFTSDQAVWLDSLFGALRGGKRLVVPTNSLVEAEALVAQIRGLHPEKEVRIYSSRTPPGQKERHFADVHTYWAGLDVLVYTPTVSAGVSFELPHFDALYGYFTDASCDVETCRQMLGRVRQLASREHVVCLVGRRNNLPTEVADISRLLRDKRTNLYREVNDAGLGFSYGPAGEVVFHESPYYHLWLETARIRNLSRNDFVGRFVAQVAATGAQVSSLEPPADLGAAARLIACRSAQSDARREVRAEDCRAIAEAPDLAPEQVEDVRRLLERQADVPPEQLRGHQKFLLREAYGWHGRPLTPEFVAKYAPREARDVYRNLRRITAGRTVIESLRAIQDQEQKRHRGLMEARLAVGGGVPAAPAASASSALESRDLHYRYAFQSHFLAIWLLRLCGFRCITDRALVREETVYNRMKAGEAEFLSQLESIAFEFGVRRPSVQHIRNEPDRPNYIMRVLYVVNAVLGKMYGIAVRRTPRREGAKDFRVVKCKNRNLFALSSERREPVDETKPQILSQLCPVGDEVADAVGNFLERAFYEAPDCEADEVPTESLEEFRALLGQGGPPPVAPPPEPPNGREVPDGADPSAGSESAEWESFLGDLLDLGAPGTPGTPEAPTGEEGGHVARAEDSDPECAELLDQLLAPAFPE